jgi:hypothetical protein
VFNFAKLKKWAKQCRHQLQVKKRALASAENVNKSARATADLKANCFLGFPCGGGGNPITNSSGGKSGFAFVKNDLIAELKLSHTVGGVSKLRTEQQKVQEEHEKEQYKRFLGQFTMENFLEKVNNSVFRTKIIKRKKSSNK